MILLTKQPIDASTLEATLQDPSSGGVTIFIGRVRDHNEGRSVSALSYEAYPEMTEKVFGQIAEEAIKKFGVKDVSIVHRIGELKIGDIAVWIGVQSAHRSETFRACEFAINELKQRAPIWKQEHYLDGRREWVACHHIPPSINSTPLSSPRRRGS